jgi:hypothetical protein
MKDVVHTSSAKFRPHATENTSVKAHGCVERSLNFGLGRIQSREKPTTGGLQRQEPVLPRQSGSRAHLQDRVHPPVPLGARATRPDPARLGQGRLLRTAGPRQLFEF